ncbi:Dethiobiotin synthetase [Oscillatoriales cyanobacterium LEGE 11467]|uniref:Dethiobiotin synthetase n=1 Tax=Zarconia navalis LEGE 11467 TaxID=1828826 RepID=A0A928Z5E3_9CYAN|nr:Dethiobiotin synthetase [Zarconia navalis]MBE9039217.1 Dethiobiotin synthetase [Zarconia navalis LEGE 11467]
MDSKTAYNFLIDQGTALVTQRNPDSFLMLLDRGKSPLPGQMTSILLALRTLYESVKNTDQLDRRIVRALHLLTFESHKLLETGRKNGVLWSPLLVADVNRLERAVDSIFAGEWVE